MIGAHTTGSNLMRMASGVQAHLVTRSSKCSREEHEACDSIQSMRIVTSGVYNEGVDQVQSDQSTVLRPSLRQLITP